MRQLPILLLVGFAPLVYLRAQEQTRFAMEDEQVKHPIVLTETALTLIAKDPGVVNVLKDSQLRAAWLSASEVHLKRGERDIVVVAEGPLSGANITTFWVLRPSNDGFELLLTVPAHDLIIKTSRSKGYRDIEALAATAVDVSTIYFRFDGNQYKPSKETSRAVR